MQAHFNVPQMHRSLGWMDSREMGNRPQSIAVVDGNAALLTSIDTAVGSACHTMLLLDSRADAYREIRRLQPSLVVVCIRLDNLRSIQLLTMLKMDPVTGGIPVNTILIDDDDAEDKLAFNEPPTSVWVN